MECDTAKMIHQGNEALVDFNRAGTPLVEIVTGPDFTSTDEVVEFLKELQRVLRYNDLSHADMEKWQMRVDVNISLRHKEKDPLGVRVEVKNINSFGMIKRAIEHEQARQEKLYEQGETFTQETRWRDDMKGASYSMRSKEDALDYRYFPEPDLPPLVIDERTIERLAKQEITVPYEIIKKFKSDYWFHKEYINALIADKEVLDYFMQTIHHLKSSDSSSGIVKNIAKWICWPIISRITKNLKSIDGLPFWHDQFVQFLKLSQPENQLKIIMEEMLSTGKTPEEIIKIKWFDAPEMDSWELWKIIQSVLDENPAIVDQYKKGKVTVIGFFVGQVMKKTGGKGNPKEIQEMVEGKLG